MAFVSRAGRMVKAVRLSESCREGQTSSKRHFTVRSRPRKGPLTCQRVSAAETRAEFLRHRANADGQAL
jgi:hypothetical protein